MGKKANTAMKKKIKKPGDKEAMNYMKMPKLDHVEGLEACEMFLVPSSFPLFLSLLEDAVPVVFGAVGWDAAVMDWQCCCMQTFYLVFFRVRQDSEDFYVNVAMKDLIRLFLQFLRGHNEVRREVCSARILAPARIQTVFRLPILIVLYFALR